MNLTKRLMILNIIFRITLLGLLPGLFFAFSAPVEAANGLNPALRQVKTADSPAVYYLDHNRGKKKTYVNEAAFLSYGNKWSDVKIVSQDELNKWSDISLVKTASSPAVYYINADKKALIANGEEFLRLGFKWSDIATISKADLNGYPLVEFKVGGGSDINNLGNGRLTVAVDKTTPAGNNLPINTKDNLVAVFNLRAEEKVVEIKSLTLSLTGIFNADVLDKIYLTNESGAVYDILPSRENRKAVFNFRNNPLIIQPGQEKKIKVFVDLANRNYLGHTLGAAIASQSDFETGSQVIATFPVKANIFKLVDGNDVLGQVKAEENPVEVSEAIIGNIGQTLNRFTIYETSGKEDLVVKEMSFVNKGTVRNSGLNNFSLRNKSNNVVANAQEMDRDGIVTFKLNNYKIKKSENETFAVIGDIIGGDGKTSNFNFKDMKISGDSLGFNLRPSYSNIDQTISIKRKPLAVIAKDLKESKNVFAEQKGVIVGVFEIRNNNQKISLESLYFSLEKNSGTTGLSKTVYLVNYETGKVYGSFSGDKFIGGLAIADLTPFSLNPQENLTLALITDMPKEIKNGDSYKIILNKINYHLENGEFYSDEVNVAGVKLVISKSNVYIYPNKEISGFDYAKGEKGVKIASFILEASAGGDAVINSLTLSRGNTSGVISFTNGFSNLKAYIGSQRSGNIIEKPFDGDYIFTGFNYRLGAGQRTEITIYVDTEKDLKASKTDFKIIGLNAIGYDSTIPAAISGLGAISSGASFHEVQAEIANVNAGNIAKGEKNNIAASFKIKNSGGEILRLSNLTINTASEGFSYSLGYSNLRVGERKSGNNVVGQISRPVAGANRIGLGNYRILVGEEVIFDVLIDASDEVPAGNISVYFSDLESYGYNSGIKTTVSGDPTSGYDFIVAAINDNNFIWPLAGKITYNFHDPNYPFNNISQHSGIDIEANQGTPVKAVVSGTVAEAVNGGSNGYSYIVISHSNGLSTVYGHLSRIDVSVGGKISQGDIIGLSGGQIGAPGSGPYTMGPHLHFEVRASGVAVDPVSYL